MKCISGVVLACSVLGAWGCVFIAPSGHAESRAPKIYEQTIAGYKVRLVAIGNPIVTPDERMADHAWNPDGSTFNGPEARLSSQNNLDAPAGGLRRRFVFELQPIKVEPSPNPASSTPIDVLAYLQNDPRPQDDKTQIPSLAGPLPVTVWRGAPPRDSSGNAILPLPQSVAMEVGLQDDRLQTITFGIAQGEFKVIAKGSISIDKLAAGETRDLAKGPWGRIEVTHLPRPLSESRPSPTHRFRLLGGPFPPTTERRVQFLNANGNVVATCGDGPNNPGNLHPPFIVGQEANGIVGFEIQERKIESVNFDGVAVKAPETKSYRGSEGASKVIQTPLGKVQGTLKSSKDGAWNGSTLYATDGTRWLDPGKDLASYEYGQFDPWNHPVEDHTELLLAPSPEVLSTLPPCRCEIYAADTADGPNMEKLSKWDEVRFQSPLTRIACEPTTRPYIRVSLKAGSTDWKTVETIPITDQMLHLNRTASDGTRILEVFVDDDGSIRIWRNEPQPIVSKARWHKDQQSVRALAILRGGGSIELTFNTAGYGATPNDNRYSGFAFIKEPNGTHIQAGFKPIEIKDIASIELQAQEFNPAVTFTVHTPPSNSVE